MQAHRPLLTIIGDIGADLVLGPLDHWPAIGTETIVERNEFRAGGSGGNAVLAARYLGQPCRLVSATGNDDLGTWLASRFEGIDTALATTKAPTSMSVGIIHSCDERTFLTTPGHLQEMELEALLPAIAAKPAPGSVALLTGAFLMPKLRRRYGDLIRHLKGLGYAIAIDTGWPSDGWTPETRTEVADWLAAADHILLNETEIIHFTGAPDVASAIGQMTGTLAAGATLVVKTGSKGAIGMEGNLTATAGSHPSAVFDTIGAGDSFNAGYLLARLEGADLVTSLSAGCNSAAAIISRFPRSAITDGELSVRAKVKHKASA